MIPWSRRQKEIEWRHNRPTLCGQRGFHLSLTGKKALSHQSLKQLKIAGRGWDMPENDLQSERWQSVTGSPRF